MQKVFEASAYAAGVAVLVAVFVSAELRDVFGEAFNVLSVAAPLWLPPLLWFRLYWIFRAYTYRFQPFNSHWENVLLEIKLPQNVDRTPAAMELVFSRLHIPSGETTWFDRFWLGKRQGVFSAEICSFGGEIQFFIWCRRFYKDLVESALYSQFPSVEIYEVPDYTTPVWFEKWRLSPGKYRMWGYEANFAKQDAYPIKTYIDYALDDAMTKEEHKVDPLSAALEYLGTCPRGGQIWIQFVFQTHKKQWRKKTGPFTFQWVDWQDEAQALVDKLMYRDPATKVSAEALARGQALSAQLSEEEQRAVTAIQRSLNKQPFDVGIRIAYVSETEVYTPLHIVGILNYWKPFNSPWLNSLGVGKRGQWHATFNFPWQFENQRENRFSRLMFNLYRRRSFFNHPYKLKPLVMTTEELATLFHFPGQVATVPTLGRIMSRKAEAPPNLPI